MAENYMTSYQPLGDQTSLACQLDDEDDSLDNNPEMLVHVVPGAGKNRWNHVKDLDSFFTRLYQYHQSNGLLCMMIQNILHLLQVLFITLFTTYIVTGINYEVLFGNKLPVHEKDTRKVTLSDVLFPISVAITRIDVYMTFFLITAILVLLFKMVHVALNYLHFCPIKDFYNAILGIQDEDLKNATWDEVQCRVMEVQVEQRMCIHKETLTELDIYHRILRFTNYFVAMVNKNILPLKLQIPFWGQHIFMTRGLQCNIEFLLFWGPWSPFKNSWHLGDDYKRHENRHKLADHLSKQMLYLGIANLFLWPLFFIWQLLNTFYYYTESVKREPGILNLRRWSHYGAVYLRHFNELDHELRSRLNRGYRAGKQYLNSYTDPMLVIVAEFISFLSASVFSVLFVLSIYDEDVLQVEHILMIFTIFFAVTAACRSIIPDVNLVYCPEILMTHILSEIHYLPDSWKGKAHTSVVREEFSQLFQSKLTHILEELFAPLICAYILCIKMRSKSLDIVDFFRNYTVEVIGVGDVCSFAQMDVRKHGSRTWQLDESDLTRPFNPSEKDVNLRTDGGKTELSLLHFTMTNPKWKPPQESSTFLTALKTQAQRDFTTLNALPEENPLYSSINSLGGGLGPLGAYLGAANNPMHLSRAQPLSNGILGSLSQSMSNSCPIMDPFLAPPRNDCENSVLQSPTYPVLLDLMAVDMNQSTLYLHELHHRRRARTNYTDHPLPAVVTERPSQNLQASYQIPMDHSTNLLEPTHSRYQATSQTPLLKNT